MNLIDIVNYLDKHYKDYENELRTHPQNVPWPILAACYKQGFIACKNAVIRCSIEHSLDADLKE